MANDISKAVLVNDHGDVLTIRHSKARGLVSKTITVDGVVEAKNVARGEVSKYRSEIRKMVRTSGFTLMSDNSVVDED